MPDRLSKGQRITLTQRLLHRYRPALCDTSPGKCPARPPETRGTGAHGAWRFAPRETSGRRRRPGGIHPHVGGGRLSDGPGDGLAVFSAVEPAQQDAQREIWRRRVGRPSVAGRPLRLHPGLLFTQSFSVRLCIFLLSSKCDIGLI